VCGSGAVVCSLFLLIRWAQRARCQAETPLIVLCRFPQPALTPALERLIQLVPENHQVADQSREEAARCLSSIAIGYTWADDFTDSEQLQKEALRFAHDTLSAVRIEHALAQVREAASKQRLLSSLTPIFSAPSLFTINGFGLTLYGRSDYDEASRSYATTHYFVALFVPVFPVGRYRVIDLGSSQYRFLGKLPFRKADYWHLGIAATAIGAMVLSGMNNSSPSISSSPSTRTSYASSSASSLSYPSSPKSRLGTLKTQIESGRSRLAVLETHLIQSLKS
jgi:hypothetical protein